MASQTVSKPKEPRRVRRVQILVPEDLHARLSAEGREQGRTVGRQLEVVLRSRFNVGGAS